MPSARSWKFRQWCRASASSRRPDASAATAAGRSRPSSCARLSPTTTTPPPWPRIPPWTRTSRPPMTPRHHRTEEASSAASSTGSGRGATPARRHHRERRRGSTEERWRRAGPRSCASRHRRSSWIGSTPRRTSTLQTATGSVLRRHSAKAAPPCVRSWRSMVLKMTLRLHPTRAGPKSASHLCPTSSPKRASLTAAPQHCARSTWLWARLTRMRTGTTYSRRARKRSRPYARTVSTPSSAPARSARCASPRSPC